MLLIFHPLVIFFPVLTLSLISVLWGGVLSDHILMMGEAENPFSISCALGSQHHKGFLQALLIISFYTLKEKLKCWWQMASFITFNWLTVLLSLWNAHFGPKHWKKNMPFTLVRCQVTLKIVQEVFARPVHGACFLQQCVSSCMMCCSLKRRLSNCIRGTFYPFLIMLKQLY